jgi:hypothetical protein
MAELFPFIRYGSRRRPKVSFALLAGVADNSVDKESSRPGVDMRTQHFVMASSASGAALRRIFERATIVSQALALTRADMPRLANKKTLSWTHPFNRSF